MKHQVIDINLPQSHPFSELLSTAIDVNRYSNDT